MESAERSRSGGDELGVSGVESGQRQGWGEEAGVDLRLKTRKVERRSEVDVDGVGQCRSCLNRARILSRIERIFVRIGCHVEVGEEEEEQASRRQH
jgi:hypothetical protein